LTPEAVHRAKITTQAVAARHIEVTVTAPGEVRLNREQMLIARPRFPGVVTEMRKRLGDQVKAGEILAVIQSNSSLTEYTIQATMDGQIVARAGMVGASVDHESLLYTLADLSTVWVDFAIYPQYVGVIQRAQPVQVHAATQQNLQASGEIDYVGPLLEADTRVSHGRIVLPNRDGAWQPGLYVNVTAIVDRADVAVAVPEGAIVRSKFGPSVFLADGSTFEIQPIVLGRSDGIFTEVLKGLCAGDTIVVSNVYLLKAELGRGEAAHDH
jgi:cobalt-zinc-cadmium efflux system membrane fusion protein